MVRILSGNLKGRKIFAKKKKSVKPILSRVKKSLFDTIFEKVKDSVFLDLFAGTGSVGFEAISRGAKKVVFIDKDVSQVKSIKRNICLLGLKNAEVYKADILRGLKWLKDKFDVVFLAPPYGKFNLENLLKIIYESDIIKQNTMVIVQHSKHEILKSDYFNIEKQKVYGETVLSFLTSGVKVKIFQKHAQS